MDQPPSRKHHFFNKPEQALARQQLRTNMPPAEEQLWPKLRGKRLLGLKFRRQHGIGQYVVDFVCVEAKLVIEVDGPTHDENLKAYDLARQTYLESMGLTVLRFYNTDVYDNWDGVLERIVEVVESKTGQ